MVKTGATHGAASLPSGEPAAARSIAAALGPPLTPDGAALPRPQPASPFPIAAGLPVDDPPPMIELVGFDDAPAEEEGPADDMPAFLAPRSLPPTSRRPPRRSFLAPSRPAASETPAAQREALPPDAPAPIAAAAPRKSLRERVAPALAFRPRLKTPTVRLAGWRMPRAGVLAACAVAAVIVIGAAAVLGRLGPFAPSPIPTRTSGPAPSSPSDRLAFYQKAADSGNAEAQLQLAILYAKGEGVTQDYAVAAKWFRTAADQGSARAQYDLGVLYERGRGVPVDLAEAAKWYQKSAEAKYPLAQYNLAVCYTKGQGIRKDLPEAALWYRRAALQGMVQAMVNLGTMYERGDGVPVSQVDAYAWYLAAGRRGNQIGSKRADDVFAALPKLDQIRAEALAGDVAASIKDANVDSPASAISPTPATTSSAVR